MSWINLSALWKIMVVGLLAGAGLPALFTVGLLSLSRGPRLRAAGPDGDTGAARGGGGSGLVGGSIAGLAVAALSFLVIGAAIGWGVYQIYVTGHPKH